MSQVAIDLRNREVFAALATLYDYCKATGDKGPRPTESEWKAAWDEAGRLLEHAHEVDHSARLINPTDDSCARCGRDIRNSIHGE